MTDTRSEDATRMLQAFDLVAEQLEIDGIIRKRPDIDALVAQSVRDS